MTNLITAVLKVMDECKGIDKSMTVGNGNSSYKGVSDKDVKLKIGQSMQKNGLVILPIDVDADTKVNSYEDQYGKQKQVVFTEVKTKYLLAHSSGESITIAGFGQGTDTQDKAAGKATTYALKYTLLYTFLVATGHIDDTDNTHSDDLPIASNKPSKKPSEPSSPAPAPTPQPKADNASNGNEKASDEQISQLRKFVAKMPTCPEKQELIELVKAGITSGRADKIIELFGKGNDAVISAMKAAKEKK